MSAAFIIDCSVTMTWLFGDEATTATAELLQRLATETALTPAWWRVEVVNVLAVAERRGRILAAQSASFISKLDCLDIEHDNQGAGRSFTHLLPLCRLHRLTSYDALYLDLAERRRLPLATLDDALRKAANKSGIALLGK